MFCNSVLSVLEDIEIDIHKNEDLYDTLKKYWKIADTYSNMYRIERYLIIAWFLDLENKKEETKETLNRLFKKDLTFVEDSELMIEFFVYSLYENYKDSMIKIFNFLSDDIIYKTSLLFVQQKNSKTAIEVFNFLSDRKPKIKKFIENLDRYNFVWKSLL